jgi:hypothetical protein
MRRSNLALRLQPSLPVDRLTKLLTDCQEDSRACPPFRQKVQTPTAGLPAALCLSWFPRIHDRHLRVRKVADVSRING